MRHALPVTVLAAGFGLAIVAGLPGERSAFAQPSPEARVEASALFDDGRRLMGEGKYAQACPKLEESYRLDPGMGTLYQVSVCYEAIGRTASAWIGFRDIAVQAAREGQAERERLARGKATALEPKLIRLKISVPQGAGVEVKRDGAVVSPALWGTSVPLDPGPHKVSASAPGKEPWEVTVQLDQQGATVNVDVPPLMEKKAGGTVTPPPPPPPDKGTPTGTPPPPPPPEVVPNPRPWQMPLGIALTAVGAVGVGVGIAVGVMAKSSYDNANQPVSMGGGGCSTSTNVCPPGPGLGQRADAVTKGNISTGVFIPSAVIAAAGIVVWATAPSSKAQKTGGVHPEIGVGPGSVTVRGRW